MRDSETGFEEAVSSSPDATECESPLPPPLDAGPQHDAGLAFDASLRSDAGDAPVEDGSDAGYAPEDGGACSVPCAQRCASPGLDLVPQLPGYQACACGLTGSTSLADGCTTTSDCALVHVDHCGCESGGFSTAILAQHVGTWQSQVDACNRNTTCFFFYECGNIGLACEQGRCVVRQVDGGVP